MPSPDALGTRLARELAVPLVGGADPLQAVISALRGRRMLLVLDNFEHLRAAAPQLQSLLDACPRAQMLVTSRVRLGLACEQLLPLDGLPCPEPEDTDCLDSFDAARLFVRAAQAVEPALQPAADAGAIAEICRLVAGLPLALEIAAAWTRALPCASIAAELRQIIELLTEDDAARPARHASMTAVFEQSWQRLSPAERTAWARLTVFHGGFTLEAARTVTGVTLPILAALIDQSLVRKTGARADLHPLLRQMAAAHLTSDDRAATCAAHAAHYLRWLVPLQRKLRSGDKQTMRQVDLEFENLRAAWRWASAHGPAAALRSAVVSLSRFCRNRGRHMECLALLNEAAGIGAHDPGLAPQLDIAAAGINMDLGQFAKAQALATRALHAAPTAHDPDTRLLCYVTLSACALETGNMLRAQRRCRQATLELTQVRADLDPVVAAAMLANLATIENKQGHYDRARDLYTQALTEHRQLRDPAGEALCLSNLGFLEINTGQFDAAAVHLEASLALCERHALRARTMLALVNLTEVCVRRGDATVGQRYGQRALELAVEIGNLDLQATVELQFAELAVLQHDTASARAWLRSAVESAITADHVPSQLDCASFFAHLVFAQGAPGAAIEVLRYVVDHPASPLPTQQRGHARLAEWSASQTGSAVLPVPAVDLRTLLHRIAAETPTAHAALIESLRVPGRP